jgi:FkbM family methyltransferase
MNLSEFIPDWLKAHLIAIWVNAISRMLVERKTPPPLLELFGVAGREILHGTALFPEEGFFVADVGAYRGWFTAISSKIVGSNGCVYSFEPEPCNFEILRKVILVGGLKNVNAFRLALSDNDGLEFLYLSQFPSMHSLLLERSHRKIAVPCMKLDTIARLKGFPRLDLVKVDVEGAELKVLKGCERIADEFKPIFSIDVNHYPGQFEEVSSFIRKFNYEIRPLYSQAGRPYSIVAYPSHKRILTEHLINKTRKLSLGVDFGGSFSDPQKRIISYEGHFNRA